MTSFIVTGSKGEEVEIEILTEEEELYIGMVRNLMDADLTQVEQALLAAGATKMSEEVGQPGRRFTIRNVGLIFSVAPYDNCKLELRFEHC
jgi:hypothetical protein